MNCAITWLIIGILAVADNVASYALLPSRTKFRSAHALRAMEGLDVIQEDCGCGTPTEFSGEPSSRAQQLNARQAVQGTSVYSATGESVVFDSLLPARESNRPVITVFLRSLG
ncbi:hypothetical protein MPSEU_000601200 [Mayamaea pseudoterrestris]|nr:hypothetical protein MPSEU_000601200 [Mayamaea pseudoterrestris]